MSGFAWFLVGVFLTFDIFIWFFALRKARPVVVQYIQHNYSPAQLDEGSNLPLD